jgi:hypothetical protein
MENYFMPNEYVTETPKQLFSAATKDIINIVKVLNDAIYPEYLSYEDICYKAAQATEKY